MHDAAVGEDRGGGEVAGAGAGEERDDAADLARVGHAADRDGGVEPLHRRGVGLGGGVDRRVDGAGPDTDDEHAVRAPARRRRCG